MSLGIKRYSVLNYKSNLNNVFYISYSSKEQYYKELQLPVDKIPSGFGSDATNINVNMTIPKIKEECRYEYSR